MTSATCKHDWHWYDGNEWEGSEWFCSKCGKIEIDLDDGLDDDQPVATAPPAAGLESP